MRVNNARLKPFYRTAVFWQSVVSLFIFPLLMLPGWLGFHLAEGDGWIILVIMAVTFAIMVSALWSYSKLAVTIIQKQLTLLSFLPAVFSSVSLYLLIAVMAGLPPFPA